ncbi:uncharacterized protein [Euphorbia lathyris]|uniref:uncharacterized protein isoform X2 n=1 Tax=Euphorbia lathyris TaxID=212925 RepID=UPI003314157E
MAPQSLSLLSPVLFIPRLHPLSSTPAICSFSFPKLSFTSSRNSIPNPFCSTPKSTQRQHEEAILQLVADSDDETLPCVRTYENDLSRLSLVGAVSLEQALTAAAADGGQAAAEHIDSGVPAMVVETVFPAPGDEHATISTRLFLPAKKVKEKAGMLKRSFAKDMLNGTPSQNILALTFRQVVMRRLWNFELVVFKPGTERDMGNLENPREVPASFMLSSSDERVISVLAEAVCIAALQNTEGNFLHGFTGNTSGGFLSWFQKPKRIMSKDSSVIIYKLLEDEILANAKSLLENFNSTKESWLKMRQKCNWWMPVTQTKLEQIGGPDFSAWTTEYVPAYRLQINADKFIDAKFEGWTRSVENMWEVLLTHSQMVELAEILDNYYEDVYSLPDKQFSCHATTTFTNFPKTKRNSSLQKILSVTLASGIFIVSISTLCQFCFPHLRRGQTYPQEHRTIPSSELELAVNEASDAEKLQDFCILIIKKIKDAYGWPGDITMESKSGAWIGEIPKYLKAIGLSNSSNEDENAASASLQNFDEDIKSAAQDIASYQVVLSSEGKIVGFQPTSRVGVNHWSANPLAGELYGGRKLSPGLIEPGLKICLPGEVHVVELLMSVNTDVQFALARPLQA